MKGVCGIEQSSKLHQVREIEREIETRLPKMGKGTKERGIITCERESRRVG